MKDTLVIFGICVAAVIIGMVLFFTGFGQSNEIPDLNTTTTTVPVPETPSTVGPVPFTVLGQGLRASGETERKNYAVRDESTFDELWLKVHGDDGEVQPTVDFDEYQVIGVFAGIKQTGGYAVSVVSVTDTETERKVVIAITEPGPTCTVSQALTNPYQLIRLPASDLPLTREYVDDIRLCD